MTASGFPSALKTTLASSKQVISAGGSSAPNIPVHTCIVWDHIRDLPAILNNSMNSLIWFNLLPQHRNAVVAAYCSVQGICSTSWVASSMGAPTPIFNPELVAGDSLETSYPLVTLGEATQRDRMGHNREIPLGAWLHVLASAG